MFARVLRAAALRRGVSVAYMRTSAGASAGAKSALESVPPEESVFARIASGAIAVERIIDNEHVLAFNDASPQAPVHVLVIPKKPIGKLSSCTDEHTLLLGHLMRGASEVARRLGLHESGFRVVVNDGRDGQQSVHWLHLHVLGGRQMRWPPG